MSVLEGTQSVSTLAPPTPSRSTTVTSAPELRGDQRGLVAGGSAADDHDAGHGGSSALSLHHPGRCAVGTPVARGAPVGLAAMGLYAAYGSNMDPAQMRGAAPHSPHTGTGWIRGLAADLRRRGVRLGGRARHPRPGRRRRRASSWPLRPHRGRRSTRSTPGRAPTRPLPAGAPARAHPRRRRRRRVYALDAFEGGLPSARHLGGDRRRSGGRRAPDDYVAELRSRECRTAF